MPFYEIIFETGSKSVAEYADDDEAMGAISAHHERAKAGEPGRGSATARTDLGDDAGRIVADYPAERIAKVYKYDTHPAEPVSPSAEVAEAQIAEALKANTQDGVVDLPKLSSDIRGMADPSQATENIHDSMFKAEPTGELDLSSLG